MGRLPRSSGWDWSAAILIAFFVPETAAHRPAAVARRRLALQLTTPTSTPRCSRSWACSSASSPLGIAILAVRSFGRVEGPPSTALAIRAGHDLPAPRSGAGRAHPRERVRADGTVANASIIGAAGELKVPHALGLHGLQVLAVLALILERTPRLRALGRDRRGDLRGRVRAAARRGDAADLRRPRPARADAAHADRRPRRRGPHRRPVSARTLGSPPTVARLDSPLMQAVVMAGGEGSRLRPLTINRPKPMVSIVNKPCLGHIFDLLQRHGINDAFVTLQYLASQIQDSFGDGGAVGMRLNYSVEESPLGTGGSVRQIGDALDDTFIVISGDALTDIDLTKVIAFHRERKAAVTLTLVPRREPARVRRRHHRRGRADLEVPREAVLGRGLLGHDQHRHLRDRAARPRALQARRGVRLQQGPVPRAARRGRAAVRLHRVGVLDRRRLDRRVRARERRPAAWPADRESAREGAPSRRLHERRRRDRRVRAHHRPGLPRERREDRPAGRDHRPDRAPRLRDRRRRRGHRPLDRVAQQLRRRAGASCTARSSAGSARSSRA